MLDQLHIDRGGLIGHLRDAVAAAESRATNSVGAILEAGTDASFGLVIALLTMYYVLLEWPTIALRLERTLPLDPRHTRALMLEFRDVGRTALIGTLATAIVQGALAWIGFSLSGVPEPLTWAFVTALASFVPLIGTSVVWGPMAIYLVSRGEIAQACLELAWGVFIVMMLADYVIRPAYRRQRRGTGIRCSCCSRSSAASRCSGWRGSSSAPSSCRSSSPSCASTSARARGSSACGPCPARRPR